MTERSEGVAAKRPNLLAELRRRNVIRVAGFYLVAAWLIVQVADTLLPVFDAPGWVMKVLVGLLAAGAIPTLIFSWVYELTPDGLKRESEIDPARSATVHTARKLDMAVIVLLLGIGALTLWGPRREAASDASAPSSAVVADAGDQAAPAPAAPSGPHPASIAVLPFANMSPDPEQEFFADGITEDILTRLASIGELRVISRTSVMRYKGSDKSLPEIAAELGVDHILEGSVRRAGNQVRITGQLIRATDDAHLWAQSFDRELADIFAVQTEIAGHIVDALALQLTEGERKGLGRQGTRDGAAYEEYLQGRAKLNASYSDFPERLALLDEAEMRFRAALARDPDYADAWIGMSRSLLTRLGIDAGQAEASYQGAVDAARQAIRLAPESSGGYVWLGRAFLARGLGEEASAQFQRAAEIDPDGVELLKVRALVLRNEGRLGEAVQLLQRAVLIEPGEATLQDSLAATLEQLGLMQRARDAYQLAWGTLTPHEARLNCMLADNSLRAGDVALARRQVARFRELEPDSPFAASCSLSLLLALQDVDAARAVLAEKREFLEDRQPDLTALTLARTQPGTDIEPLLSRAEQRLREDLPRVWGSALEVDLARIALLRGDHEAALSHLEAGISLGWREYRGLERDPHWDPVRDDPRFQALARRVDEDLARQRDELAAAATAP